MSEFSEEQVAELITLLPAPPTGWVEAAVELPRSRAVIDELAARAVADQVLRRAILADLEKALHDSGVDPRPEILESLRARLSESG